MARHGRLQTFENKKKVIGFGEKLDTAIEKLKSICPEEWQFVLDYIDSEATPPSGIFSHVYGDSHIVREMFKRQGKAEIFYRLARIKQQEEKRGDR